MSRKKKEDEFTAWDNVWIPIALIFGVLFILAGIVQSVQSGHTFIKYIDTKIVTEEELGQILCKENGGWWHPFFDKCVTNTIDISW